MLSQGDGCGKDVAGQWQQTRPRYDKSPTSKIYTTWAPILSDRYICCILREGQKMAGSNAPGAFLVFHGHLPQTRFSLGQTNIRRKLQSHRLGSYLERL